MFRTTLLKAALTAWCSSVVGARMIGKKKLGGTKAKGKHAAIVRDMPAASSPHTKA